MLRTSAPLIGTLERIDMQSLARDPITHAVNGGIRRGIEVALAAEAYPSAVILIYSGIDSMAYLAMPDGQDDVRRPDFVDWASRYLRFPCAHQLTGNDLYGARCAMLHNYSVTSRMSRSGECRKIGYMNHSVPEVRYDPTVDPSLVMVSIVGLAEAFFRGIDQFLVNAFEQRERHPLLERRLASFVQCIPHEEE